MSTKEKQVALRTSLFYAGIAAFWILFSDWILILVIQDPKTFGRLSVYFYFVTIGLDRALHYM